MHTEPRRLDRRAAGGTALRVEPARRRQHQVNPWTETDGALNGPEHAESAQRYGRSAKSKHFRLPQTGSEASLGSCRERLKRLCSLAID